MLSKFTSLLHRKRLYISMVYYWCSSKTCYSMLCFDRNNNNNFKRQKILGNVMEPPLKPNDSDCCNSGCNPCIFDVYEEQLQKYSHNLKKYQEEVISSSQNCICPTAYSMFKLVSKDNHTSNSCLFKFEYCRSPNQNDANHEKKLVYGTGQHFLLKGRELNSINEFTRAYTPIPYGENDDKSFTILVRLYEKGKMSSYLRDLIIGDETLWRGPYCDYKIDYSLTNILFIAQGTGIAPIYSILKTMLSDPFCETFLHLFFCCRSCDEIFLRNEIYQLKSHWNFTYEVYLSDNDNISSKYEEIIHDKKLENKDMDTFINKIKGTNLQVVICGSEKFEKCISDHVKDCGIKDQNIFIFE